MRLKFIIALLLVGGALSAQVRPWKKQTIPVSTPWFEDISPEMCGRNIRVRNWNARNG